MVQILETDIPEVIAGKIFNEFEINQSCSVYGLTEYMGKIVSVGSLVLDILRILDTNRNMQQSEGKKPRRKRRMLPNSIGGYVAHKIFRYKEEILETDVKVTIWRIQ